MASFNKLIDHNKHMSILLFGVMAVLFAFFGASLGAYWGGDWLTGVIIAVAVAGLYFFISWRFGASMILASSGAKEISHDEAPSSGTWWRSFPSQEGCPCRRCTSSRTRP